MAHAQSPVAAKFSSKDGTVHDSEDKLRIQILTWYNEANEAFQDHYDNRITDYGYYDNYQFTEEELQILEQRKQPATVINRVRVSVELVMGIFDRLRSDATILPRGTHDDDWATAQSLTHASKYVEDQNASTAHFRRMFGDLVIGGVAWAETSLNEDPTGEEIKENWVDWRDIRPDPMSREEDYSDGRYLFRVKWLGMEQAKVLFPEHAEKFDNMENMPLPQGSSAIIAGDTDFAGVKQMANTEGTTSWESLYTLNWYDPHNDRVLLIECWYYEWDRASFLRDRRTGRVFEIDPKNLSEMETQLIMAGLTGQLPIEILEDRPVKRCKRALLAGPHVLETIDSPYTHGKIPFVPFYAWRDHRSGECHGLVRIMRDPQDAANKALSKMIHALATRQVLMEKGAGDVELVRREIAKPDGVIQFERNAMAEGKVRIETNNTDARIYQQVFEMFHRIMGDLAGGLELQAMQSNATSGRAIALRQEQGHSTLSTLFVHFRNAKKLLVEQRLSNMQQFWTGEKVIRISETLNPDQREVVVLNEMLADGKLRNDITAIKADVVIDEQAARASSRQAFADKLMELTASLPPEVGLGLMDIVVDMSDIPDRPLIKQRIQQILGMAQQSQQQAQAQQGAQPNMQGSPPPDLLPGEAAGFTPDVMSRMTGADTAAGNVQGGH